MLNINKYFDLSGKTNKEFNMRHDWNSLLSDDESLLMTRYSKEFFPPADSLVSFISHDPLPRRPVPIQSKVYLVSFASFPYVKLSYIIMHREGIK